MERQVRLGLHSLDVPWVVVEAVMIDVVSMLTWQVGVDLVAQIPLVRQPVRCQHMPIDRLIDHLVTPSEGSVQGHQG